MAKKAIVIGAGIVGLATARALAITGYKVTVIERNLKATGASVRNFGMIWPVGQPDGDLYDIADRSAIIWKEMCNAAGVWLEEAGSLHLAYKNDELAVLEDFISIADKKRNNKMLLPQEVTALSKVAVTKGLLGALWSPNELIVDPRQAIAAIPDWLNEKYGVVFEWGKVVTQINFPVVNSNKQKWEADCVYVCSGADFETLYPDVYADAPLTKCKLQMMRLKAQPADERIGPALCGALSLTHYHSFSIAPSLPVLHKRIADEYPEYVKWGIHVMAAQTQSGEITIGDSHEYGDVHNPFDQQEVNNLILAYLKKMAQFTDETVVESWHGIYAKLTDGKAWLVFNPEAGVTIINGLGGAGMTLSFGLCEKLVVV